MLSVFAYIKTLPLIFLLLFTVTAHAQEEELSGVLMSYQDRAEALKQEGNWPALEQTAEQWVAKKKGSWEPWYYLGIARLELGKNDGALTAFKLARKLSPQKNDQLLLLIGDTCAKTERWQEAIVIYRELLERYPNNATLWEKLYHTTEGELLLPPPDVAEVKQTLIDILQKLLTFGNHAKDDVLRKRYANLLEEAGQDDKARVAYGQLLQLRPADLPVLEWIFRYDVDHADADTLRKTINYMQRRDRENPLLHLYLGQQAQAAGDPREAKRHYTIISTNGQYPQQQAQALAGLGDLTSSTQRSKALDYYQKAINADPSYLYAWERIVVILRAQNRHRLAQRYFTRLRQVQKLIEADETVTRSVLHNIENS